MLIAEEGDEYPVLKSSRSEQNVARFWNIVQATMNTCIPYCNQFLNSNDYCEGGGGRGGVEIAGALEPKIGSMYENISS